MMFHLIFTSSLLSIILLLASVNGLCLPCQSAFSNPRLSSLSRRDVYSPKITSPTAATIWKVGSQVTVTWDVVNMPKDKADAKGKIVLGYLTSGSENEHLNMDHPLSDGFPLHQGKVTFKVPPVQARDDYIVVLFGDSGNHSPCFRIEGP